MAISAGDLTLQVVFSRAFLLELERGNLQAATVFARAFLRHKESPASPSRRVIDAGPSGA